MPLAISSILTFLFAFVFTVSLTKEFIPILAAKKMGQSILEIGPVWHKAKEGTPTMGGVVFLFGIPVFALFGTLLTQKTIPRTLVILLLYAVANGLCGVVDDIAKLKNKKNQGLLPWQKLLWQGICAFTLLWALEALTEGVLPLQIPYSSLTLGVPLIAYFLLMLFSVGTVNFVNLSDGIDGLAGATSFIVGVFFATEGYLRENLALLSLGLAMAGCMLGFLLFNHHPARIFMGDSGSLFLGGLTVGGAFLMGEPMTIPIFGAFYVLEGVSVILQVLFFKCTGRRLFLMAPLHHHLEKKGWSENKIVYIFVLLTALAALAAHFA